MFVCLVSFSLTHISLHICMFAFFNSQSMCVALSSFSVIILKASVSLSGQTVISEDIDV